MSDRSFHDWAQGETNDFEVRVAGKDDLSYIDYLQKKNAEDLAFYPTQVFEREVENHRIILGRFNAQHAGYLYHGAFGVTCKINQACIQYDLRGQLYGAALVRHLVTLCEAANTMSIILGCGSDILANKFWKAMGFYCYAVTQGGARRMRDINNWRLDLHPQLFEVSTQPSQKKKSASQWGKRDRSTGKKSPFLRGRQTRQYRKVIEGHNGS